MMISAGLQSAAQYLRMSTEHQQYSMQNQSERISSYAGEHGFLVTRTYSDAARSGIVLKNRHGLQQLLKDVVSGNATYKAVLVYDVSRWGRFQDTDEAAHYEFLCKSAGIPVHYCAESFANDGTFPSLIMKALKRTMAGEYSRELGVKIVAGQKRLLQLGFRQGGLPGYGLRRVLVSADGFRKQELKPGEHKSIATDRVILVLGPEEEVQLVREVYRDFVENKRTIPQIVQKLNFRGVGHVGTGPWTYQAVHTLLTHPKYAGFNVRGRTTARLHTRIVQVPRSEWTLVPGAFEPLTDSTVFAKTRALLDSRTTTKSNEELLEALRKVLREKGRLTSGIVAGSPDLPSVGAFRSRFGGLRHAYELIGYERGWGMKRNERYWRLKALREKLMSEIIRLAPEPITLEKRVGCWLNRLRLRGGRLVAVLMCPCIAVWKESVRWYLGPSKKENRVTVVIARATRENDAIKDIFVLPNMPSTPTRLTDDDPRLRRGVRLIDLSRFCSVVRSVRKKA